MDNMLSQRSWMMDRRNTDLDAEIYYRQLNLTKFSLKMTHKLHLFVLVYLSNGIAEALEHSHSYY